MQKQNANYSSQGKDNDKCVHLREVLNSISSGVTNPDSDKY